MRTMSFAGAKVAPAVLAAVASCWVAAASPSWAQDAAKKFNINIASVILAEPDIETPLPIQIAPSDAVPKNSFLRVRGLPPSATLSLGHVISPGSWAVPLSALPTLKLTAPISAASKSQLSISLVGVDGTVWAETKASLVVIPASSLPVGAQTPPPAPPTTVATVGPSGIAPPAPPPPVAATPPPRAPENPRAVGLVAKGDEQLRDGDVAGARLFYQRAADLGLARAAIALAETYDPNELSRLGVRGMQPDVKAAQHWYEKASQLGAPEATERLRRLTLR